MLKNRITAVMAVSLMTMVSTAGLYALSVGGHISGASGVSSIRSMGSSSDVDYILGAGFLLDTALARDKTFNYRFGVGYENIMKSGNSFFDKWCFHRISFSNTFGYAFYRTEHFRLWMGPQIELSGQFGKIESRRIDVVFYRINGSIPVQSEYHSTDFAVFSFGIGAVLGFNINLAEKFSITHELGLNACIGVGPYSEKNSTYLYIPGVYTLPDRSSHSFDAAFGRVNMFTRVGFMYRLEDEFAMESAGASTIQLQKKR